MRSFACLVVLLFALVAAAPASARDAAEQQRIDYLIAGIEHLDGAKFIRNGSAYDAAEAADHLRRKLRSAGERIRTAEQFIDELATKSSMSGEKYQIRLADGRVLESAVFFRERLAAYPP